ncbi:MAG: hypothetical protein E6K68_07935 [Nitrospirae bacterium]|nr:MAG: hypothetical protein E6K68_07935 [Nitrospirota bacterium]
MPADQTMNSARRRPQYLDTFLLLNLEGPAVASVPTVRRSWWLIAGLTLLVVFIIGLGFTGVIR